LSPTHVEQIVINRINKLNTSLNGMRICKKAKKINNICNEDNKDKLLQWINDVYEIYLNNCHDTNVLKHIACSNPSYEWVSQFVVIEREINKIK
jgi:hypothetical protein